MDDTIDIAALAHEAGIPADDRGVAAFARLIAERCASLCDVAEPIGEADSVTETDARVVGRELGAQIRAVFGVW